MRLRQHIKEEQIKDIISNLKDRGIDPDKTKVFVDKEKNIAFFLLYNLSGKLVGYQMYNPNGIKGINYSNNSGKNIDRKDLMRYYTYITRENDKVKHIAVYGLETYNYKEKYLFVVEGIFDAIKLHRQGLPAIAVLTNDPKIFKEWFRILPQKIIVIKDNDKAGNKLTNFGDESFTVPDGFKDLGDMSDDEVKEYIKGLKL